MFANADQFHALYVCQTSVFFFYFYVWGHPKQLVSTAEVPDEGLWHRLILTATAARITTNCQLGQLRTLWWSVGYYDECVSLEFPSPYHSPRLGRCSKSTVLKNE